MHFYLKIIIYITLVVVSGLIGLIFNFDKFYLISMFVLTPIFLLSINRRKKTKSDSTEDN